MLPLQQGNANVAAHPR